MVSFWGCVNLSVGVVKKINVSSLEGGLVRDVESDVRLGLFLLLGVALGSVWMGKSQAS